MSIKISSRAEKQFLKLPKFDQIAVSKKIRSLLVPNIVSAEKLSGYKDVYRVRVGDYRVVYKRSESEVYIILIRHRRDVYKLLKDILI